MADIFVSYAQKDKAWVGKFVNALRAQGWEVWWDLEIRGGERIDRAIERTLPLVKCVVVVWSQNAYESDWVREEAHWAKQHDKLLSIRIQADLRLPIGFTGVLTDDFSCWDGSRDSAEFRKLVKDIQSVFVAPQEVANPEIASPARMREPLSCFRDQLRVGGEGPEMVVIPAGPFRMGSSEDDSEASKTEMPRHRVEIKRRFALAKTAVTFAAYDLFVEDCGKYWPDDGGWGRGNRPVINVSWHEVVAYAEWLCEQTGRRYRLPSEAEWEYACRAGTQSRWSFGDQRSDLDKYAWFSENSREKTHPVAEKGANPWGLHDIHGNVCEWVEDCWYDNYKGAPDNGSAWGEEGGGDCGQPVIRGGSWYHEPGCLRSAFRFRLSSDFRHIYVGFRLAQDL